MEHGFATGWLAQAGWWLATASGLWVLWRELGPVLGRLARMSRACAAWSREGAACMRRDLVRRALWLAAAGVLASLAWPVLLRVTARAVL